MKTRPYTVFHAITSLGRWRANGLHALRAAWETFAMSMLGWEVESYVFRVWPDCGRHTGQVWRKLPCYPGDVDLPPMLGGIPVPGWGLAAGPYSWPEVWPSPVDAITSEHKAVMHAVGEAEAIRRNKPRDKP